MTEPPPPPADGAADRHLLERRLDGETLLSGGFLTVCRDRVALPDGTEATREFVRHSGAVAVIPVLDDGRVVLVRQHRYPVDRVLLEWPAGKLEAGEEPRRCAERELLEETGYTAAAWAFAGEIHNAAAYSSESIWLWFARDLRPGPARPDAGEFVETVTMTVEELVALDLRGELTDVKTLIGLRWLQQVLRGERRCTWVGTEA